VATVAHVNGNGKFNRNGADERFVRKRVKSLKPSPENARLYKPKHIDDPEIVALAESIAKNGCDPLTTTRDGYIVAGHCRQLALLRNGQEFVRCRVLPKRRREYSDSEYVTLLREYNTQRHKTVAEQVREEVIDCDKDRADDHLWDLATQSVCRPEDQGLAELVLGPPKRRPAISEDKAEHVRLILKIVDELQEFWPLSSRGVHYPLLDYDFIRGYYQPKRKDDDFGRGPRTLYYANDDDSYYATCDLIVRLRLDGTIPWKAFDDPTRPLEDFPAFDDVRQFIRQEDERLYCGFWRKVLKTQPNYICVVCEKNTIYPQVLRVTRKYHVPTLSGRGFCSIDPWHDLYERYRASGKRRLIVVTVTDWDPEGLLIPLIGGRTLRDDFFAKDGVDPALLSVFRAAVTREQVDKYKLPEQKFAKESSKNRDWFLRQTGGDPAVWEADALGPHRLMRELEKVLAKVIDPDLFDREVEIEREELAFLEGRRGKIREFLRSLD
jgi:hypothetical protein